MVTTAISPLERQAAQLQRQIREVRQGQSEAERPHKTAVEMARDIGLGLDSWQVRALETDAKDIMLLAARQAGKSTVAGVAALHEAVYVPGSLTLIVSPSERQSKRLLKATRKLYEHVRSAAPPVTEGMLSIELRNGSEIHALPGSEETIRGFSAVDLLILDEGARIEDPLYAAVRPMLAVSNGRLMAMSTPFGRRGWYWEEWDAGTGWHRELITAYEIDRIDRAWLERERNRIGDWMFRQEFLCEFVDAEDQFFASEIIDAAFENNLEPLFGELS